MWLWILLGVVVLAALVVTGATFYFFRFSILRFKHERTDRQYEEKDSIWHPYRERMEEAQTWIREHTAELAEMLSFDGLRLRALYLPAEEERPRGTIIAFHGYRSLATIDFALEARFFHEQGYQLLLPYQRSHGESEGKYITYGVKEQYDCQDWARYVRDRFGVQMDIFLSGISMGASTVLMASGLTLPKNVRGIIADCGFTSPWEIMKHVSRRDFKLPSFPLLHLLDLLTRLRAGFSLKEADTCKALRENRLPVLFLHGEEDDFVPLSMTRQNFSACRAEKDVFLVKGAGHAQSFATDTEGCGEKIAEFLQKYGTAATHNELL